MTDSLDLRSRRLLLTAFRFACPDSPASCAQVLTQYAVAKDLVGPRDAIRGETLRSWAVDGKPPLWAALAAGRWLAENGFAPANEEESAALRAALVFRMRKTE